MNKVLISVGLPIVAANLTILQSDGILWHVSIRPNLQSEKYTKYSAHHYIIIMRSFLFQWKYETGERERVRIFKGWGEVRER